MDRITKLLEILVTKNVSFKCMQNKYRIIIIINKEPSDLIKAYIYDATAFYSMTNVCENEKILTYSNKTGTRNIIIRKEKEN